MVGVDKESVGGQGPKSVLECTGVSRRYQRGSDDKGFKMAFSRVGEDVMSP